MTTQPIIEFRIRKAYRQNNYEYVWRYEKTTSAWLWIKDESAEALIASGKGILINDTRKTN
jgi:hypothetical protein